MLQSMPLSYGLTNLTPQSAFVVKKKVKHVSYIEHTKEVLIARLKYLYRVQVQHLTEAVPSSGIQDISSSLSGKSHLLAIRNSKRAGHLQLVKKESKAREV
jgi:hypothetical protein